MVADVKFIYASNSKGVIGHNNKLLWHIPEDLALFKQKTLHCNVLMGRKTYDSLLDSFRPLPNRTSYIATRSGMTAPQRGHIVNDPVEFIRKFNKPIWVAGGAELFTQLEEFCSEVHHTEVINDWNCGDTVYRGNHSNWDVTSDTGPLTSRVEGALYRVRVYNRQFVLKGVVA